VNQFIEGCRREWNRLRVPDQIANEMAADLAADLEEAESEGASAEELLGSAAADPRSFAESWAAERGLIPPPRLTARLRRRSLVLTAIAALTVIAGIGAALVVFASPDASPRTAAIRLPAPSSYPMAVSFDKEPALRAVLVVTREAELAHEHAQLRASAGAAAVVQANGDIVLTVLQGHSPGVEIHTVGSILLIVGIAGAILSVLFLFWSSRARPGHWLRSA
jgi:hypothetical protein